MNDEMYKALSKGYADEVEQLNALELIETQQNSIMHRNDLLAELARNVEELQAEVARLREVLEGIAQFKFYDGFPTPEAGRASAALEYGEDK
tara:strand:+ start:755 stop:1030 length:276 start_codon:yes stop_codon:yes gene_type:complete